MYACNHIRPAESHPFSAFGAEEDRLRRFFCLRQQAATHYFSTSKAKMHFGWNCIKRRSNKQAREGWRLARIRQMLPARLSETCLSLLSSGDPLCVTLTAIKPSSWFLAHMRSQTELLMKYERPFLLGLELDVLFLLDICWTFHSHTLNPHSDQVFTLNPSFINAQVDLTYSAVWGCGCIYESLTCGGKLTFFCVCVWDGFFYFFILVCGT